MPGRIRVGNVNYAVVFGIYSPVAFILTIYFLYGDFQDKTNDLLLYLETTGLFVLCWFLTIVFAFYCKRQAIALLIGVASFPLGIVILWMLNGLFPSYLNVAFTVSVAYIAVPVTVGWANYTINETLKSWRMHGKAFIKRVYLTAVLRGKIEKYTWLEFTVYLIIDIVAVILLAVITIKSLWLIVLCSALIVVNYQLQRALPPFILLLAVSNTRSLGLQSKLTKHLVPLRVLSLLDFTLRQESTGPLRGLLSFRTKLDDSTWRGIVLNLMQTARFIVVDTRNATPSLLEEITMILNHYYKTKTIFIIDETGESPALERLHDYRVLPGEICTYNEEQLFTRLQNGSLLETVVEVPAESEIHRKYLSLAEAGDTRFQLVLSHRYHNGYGVTQDKAHASEWLIRAANGGNSQAQAVLGYRLYEEENYAEANQWFDQASAGGNALGLYFSSVCHQRGLGVQENIEIAKERFTASAEQEFPDSQFELARILYETKTDEHVKASFAWFSRAAEAGQLNAQNALGVMYLKGDGVERDYERAKVWFLKAANNGLRDAQHNLGYMIESKFGFSEKDKLKADAWYLKAAEQDHVPSLVRLAERATFRRYTFKWYYTAAQLDDPFSQSMVGSLYERGDGVRKNLKHAVEWYEKAAFHDNSYAKERLAKIGKSS